MIGFWKTFLFSRILFSSLFSGGETTSITNKQEVQERPEQILEPPTVVLHADQGGYSIGHRVDGSCDTKTRQQNYHPSWIAQYGDQS